MLSNDDYSSICVKLSEGGAQVLISSREKGIGISMTV